MKLTVAVLAILLSGCVSMSDVKKQTPVYDAPIKGYYSALARCVADTMQTHESWGIRAAHYNVRVYPDIETAEVQSSASSGLTGTIYGFLLELKKIDQEKSYATLRGVLADVQEALKTLKSCSAQS
jgi:hypothetical protein